MKIDPGDTAAVLLAAGESLRFGGDKLSASLEGETILARAAEVLRASRCGRYAGVVSGNHSNRERILKTSGFTPVINCDAACGISASIRCGVEWASQLGAGAVLIALGDMPLILRTHYAALFNIANEAGEGLAFTTVDGARMPPALFDRSWFARLKSLSGDEGAKPLLLDAAANAGVPASGEMLLDVDSPSDIHRASAFLKKTQQSDNAPDISG